MLMRTTRREVCAKAFKKFDHCHTAARGGEYPRTISQIWGSQYGPVLGPALVFALFTAPISVPNSGPSFFELGLPKAPSRLSSETKNLSHCGLISRHDLS